MNDLDPPTPRRSDDTATFAGSETAFGIDGPLAPAPTPGPTFHPGELLAERFRIVRFLDRGGMGEVYEAHDLRLDSRVALKLLRRDIWGDEQAQRRFRREVQILREVAHHNVCRVFDVIRHSIVDRAGHAVDVDGFAMELLSGETLAARIERVGRIPPEEALPIAEAIAAALDATHAVGVVHRDLKSSNVMLVPEGSGERVVVTDFGVARHTARGRHTADLTATAVAIGSVDYMAPEQAQGLAPSAASDVYALGVVLFEMVTGTRPHAGENAVALLLERVRGRPPSPRTHVPTLSGRWEHVIRRCLEPDPVDRFPTAGAAVAALRGDAPVGGWRGRWRRLLRGPGGAVAAAVATVAVLLVAWWLARGPRPRPVAMPPPIQLTSSAALDIDPEFSPDGRSVVFSTNRSGLFELVELAVDGRGEERTLTADGRQNFQPEFSPDGRRIVYASHGRGGLWWLPADGGDPRQLTTFGSHPAWSPDGRWIAFQSAASAELSANAVNAMPPSTLWIVAADGDEPRQVTHPGRPPGGHGAPAWTEDGRRLYFTASDRRWSEIWSVEPDGRGIQPIVTSFPAALDPVVGADGRELLFAGVWEGERYGVWRVPLAADGTPAGDPTPVSGMGMANLRHFAIEPHGRQAVYTALTTISDLWRVDVDPADGAPRGEAAPMTRSSGRHSRPAYSPDGRLIALDSWQVGRDQDIWVMQADGTGRQRLTGPGSMDTLASWLPDGRGVVYFSDRAGAAGLWRQLLGDPVPQPALRLGNEVDVIRLSPDGRQVAFHAPGPDGVLNVWVAGLDGSGRRQITFERELGGFPCWSTDGRWLAFEARRDGDDQVAVVAADGGPVELLTDQPGKSWPFDVNRDRVAFAALRDGGWDIWWVSRSTREQRRLTHLESRTGYVRYPAWSPAGDRVVFERAETTGDLWLVDHLE